MNNIKNTCIYKKDNGYLYIPESKININNEYKAAVGDIVSFFNNLDNKNIHSVYLRGSVVFGTAIKNISDIDFFILTIRPVTEFDRLNIKEYSDKLKIKYPFITKFDFGYFSKDQILSMKENVLIKLYSICIYGNDISNQIKNPKPGKDVTISLSLLESEIIKTKKEIKNNIYNKNNTKDMCTWIMKRIVRSGLEIVSEREGCFTRDLQECGIKFLKYYPDKKVEIETAILLAIKPVNEISVIETIMDNLGYWMVHEGKRHGLI